MEHEKPNDTFHWKNKLDELDQLPGERARDKSASWEKLHHRLLEKHRHKKSLWYWLAAACILLLLAVGLPWIITHQKDDKPLTAEKSPEFKQPVNKIKETKEKSSGTKATNVISESEKKKQTAVTFTNQNHAIIKNRAVSDNSVVTDTSTVKQPVEEIIVSDFSALDTIVSNLVSAAPAKKKLRVVHINELGKSVEEETQYARIISSNTLQGKLFNQDNMSAFSLSRNTSDNFIKIKLSPSN